jgi:hypothetical protein
LKVQAIEQDDNDDAPTIQFSDAPRVSLLSSSHLSLAEFHKALMEEEHILFKLPNMETREVPVESQGLDEVYILKDESDLIPVSEEFMVAFTSISTIAAIKMENLYLNLYNFIKCTNGLVCRIPCNSYIFIDTITQTKLRNRFTVCQCLFEDVIYSSRHIQFRKGEA